MIRRPFPWSWTILIGLLALLATACGTQAQPMRDELQRLKELYDQGLITKTIYEEKVRAALNQVSAGGRRPRQRASPPSSSATQQDRVSGIWHLRVEGLGIWAPPYTLDKSIGMLYWKLSLTPNRLSVREYSPSLEVTLLPGVGLRDYPFKEVRIRDVEVKKDPITSEVTLITFKVKGTYGAYESYHLAQFLDEEIIGTYTVFDRFGGGPGSGPEYRGRLILEKMG